MKKHLLFSLLFPVAVFAGSGKGEVEIEAIGKWNSEQIVFFYTTSHENKPNCNTYHKRWALDLSSDLGRAQYSLLLAAQSAGRMVEVRGHALCDIWSDSESVRWVGFPIDYSKYPN